MEQIKEKHQSDLALVKEKASNSFEKKNAEKETELVDLKAKIETQKQDKEIAVSEMEKSMLDKLMEQEMK